MKPLQRLATGISIMACAAATAQPLVVPHDSARWELQGRTQQAHYQGRACLQLDGASAVLKDFELRDGVVDVDVFTPATRGFFGIQFRIDDTGANSEWVYLRQHKSTLPDAMQYTPVLNTGLNWQIYSGPGFTGPVEVPVNRWFHLRLDVTGAQARLFVSDMDKPALVMDDLKSGIQKGQLAFSSLTGATCIASFTVRKTPDAPWQRHWPAMPPGTITKWQISPSLDALARDIEKPLAASEAAAMTWKDVEAEPPGFVVLYRYFEAPHPRVTFANDFSKRLDPQPGMRVLYARTQIEATRAGLRKLNLGYSDNVTVFLNGQPLYSGRSPQNFRDPGFLGIMDVESDAVFLPLRQGRNELVLAVSELGGGWGFAARLAPENATP